MNASRKDVMIWQSFWNDSEQVRNADFRRQVGRTFRGEPYSEQQLDSLVANIQKHLEIAPGQSLLELACGNGLLTKRLAKSFDRVFAVDYSRPLIEVAKQHFKADNITYHFGHAEELNGLEDQYDRVLMSAAIQHFSPPQARKMLNRLAPLVKPGGLILFADVADGDRIWNFYRGIPGRLSYAVGVVLGRPIIGHWWSPAALHRLTDELGWTLSIHYQSSEQPNHYFRFDAVLRVPGIRNADYPSSPLRYSGK